MSVSPPPVLPSTSDKVVSPDSPLSSLTRLVSSSLKPPASSLGEASAESCLRTEGATVRDFKFRFSLWFSITPVVSWMTSSLTVVVSSGIFWISINFQLEINNVFLFICLHLLTFVLWLTSPALIRPIRAFAGPVASPRTQDTLSHVTPVLWNFKQKVCVKNTYQSFAALDWIWPESISYGMVVTGSAVWGVPCIPGHRNTGALAIDLDYSFNFWQRVLLSFHNFNIVLKAISYPFSPHLGPLAVHLITGIRALLPPVAPLPTIYARTIVTSEHSNLSI